MQSKTGDFSPPQPFIIPHCIILLHICPRGMEISPPVESPFRSWCIIRFPSLFVVRSLLVSECAALSTQICRVVIRGWAALKECRLQDDVHLGLQLSVFSIT